jgi:hypothetical protein
LDTKAKHHKTETGQQFPISRNCFGYNSGFSPTDQRKASFEIVFQIQGSKLEKLKIQK